MESRSRLGDARARLVVSSPVGLVVVERGAIWTNRVRRAVPSDRSARISRPYRWAASGEQMAASCSADGADRDRAASAVEAPGRKRAWGRRPASRPRVEAYAWGWLATVRTCSKEVPGAAARTK
jgi:hypothetical protein